MDERQSNTESAPGPFTCTKCGEAKPAGAFNRKTAASTGYSPSCRACEKARLANRVHAPLPEGTLLLCTACATEKPPSAFRKHAGSALGYRRQCRECQNAQNTQYRQDNPEKRRATLMASRLAHLEQDRAKGRIRAKIYRETHPEETAAYSKAWDEAHPGYYAQYRKEHPEEIKARQLAWSLANPEKKRATTAAYAAAHPERRRATVQRRRALKRTATVEKFTDLEIFIRDNWVCGLCHKKVNKRLKWPHPLSPSIDHVCPLDNGGAHSRQNVVLAHLRCNISKGTRAVTQQQRLF